MMSLPPILVINLERSKDRRQHMEKELGRFGVDYSFFPAVDGKDLSKVDEKHYSMRADLASKGCLTKDDGIGCSLSHARIYEKMVAEKMQELLILEDDCIFEDHFFEILKERNTWLPIDWKIVNFSCACEDTFKQREDIMPVCKVEASGSTLELLQIYKYHGRTSCYLLSLEAARRLLQLAYPILRYADSLLGDVLFHKLDSYTIFPPLVEVRIKNILPTTLPLVYNNVGFLRTPLKIRWRTLLCALRYRDARKAYVKFRVQMLLQMLRSVCTRLFRTRV